MPDTDLTTGVLARVDGGVVLTVTDPHGNRTFRETRRQGNEVEFKVNIAGGQRLTPRYVADISAAMLKSALECAWLDHGDRMYGPEFHHVRDAVLGKQWDGCVSVLKKGDPREFGLRLTYDFMRDEQGQEGLWVHGQYYFASILTNSLVARPLGEPMEDLIEAICFEKADFVDDDAATGSTVP